MSVRPSIFSERVYILESVLLYATLIGNSTSSALDIHKEAPARVREFTVALPLIFEWFSTQHRLSPLLEPSACRV